MIKIDSLYKYYGARRAIGPMSTEIEQGEVIGLLGLNGAGKTTALRILACDLLPSSGSVRVDGIDVVEEPERVRPLIGYLPDVPPVYEEMTVRRYLHFAAELRRTPRAKLTASVGSAAEAAALQDVIDEPIGSLSHGFRQRVGIAQAIVHAPKLVVLDEPSSGLDPVQIREMRELVRSLGGKHTVLVSSHNLPEITQMCDRLLVIGDGTIVASGTEAELVQRWAQGDSLHVSLLPAEGVPEEAVRDWLAAFPGVENVSLTRSAEALPNALSFELESTRELRVELAKAVIEKGWGLLNLSKSHRELEVVFSRLAFSSAQDGAPEQEQAA